MKAILVLVTNLLPGAADKAGISQILPVQVGEDLMEEWCEKILLKRGIQIYKNKHTISLLQNILRIGK